MGITIHFKGKLKNTHLINSLMDELIDISETMKWEWQSLDEDWSKPATAKFSVNNNKNEIIGHLPLKGIQISIHPDAEPLSLYFDNEGNVTTPMLVILMTEGKIKPGKVYSTVKTQFAPPDIHITIIKLLKYIKKRYIPNLNVIDEGGYWESEDKQKLIEKMTFLKGKMDEVEEIVSSLDQQYISQRSSEQLANILEERLKKKL